MKTKLIINLKSTEITTVGLRYIITVKQQPKDLKYISSFSKELSRK